MLSIGKHKLDEFKDDKCKYLFSFTLITGTGIDNTDDMAEQRQFDSFQAQDEDGYVNNFNDDFDIDLLKIAKMTRVIEWQVRGFDRPRCEFMTTKYMTFDKFKHFVDMSIELSLNEVFKDDEILVVEAIEE